MNADVLAAAWTIALVVGGIVAVWVLASFALMVWRARQVRLDRATEIRLVQMEASWRLHELSRNAFASMLDTARQSQPPKD